MELKLVVTNKDSNEVSETFIKLNERIVIGRHADSPVLLQGEALSRQHFSIVEKDGKLSIENMSRNWTRLNGESLPTGSAGALAAEDVIEMPGYEMRVEFPDKDSDDSSEVNAAGTNAPAAKVTLVKSVIRAATNFFDPLEIMLVVCALVSLALTAYYLLS